MDGRTDRCSTKKGSALSWISKWKDWWVRVTDDSEMCCDRPVDLTLAPIDERNDGRVKTVIQLMIGWWEDREDISRPAWKTTVFFLHPESSWRFRKSPLAVSFTWKLASESLGDHNIVSACSTILGWRWMFLSRIVFGTRALTYRAELMEIQFILLASKTKKKKGLQ